ncbi:MAG: lamin tail domain-containing protein, partial [Verrucomicrobiales bacterium]
MRSLFLSLLALSTFSVFITPLSADILISEVMTDNEDTLLAADGSSPDWLELHNDGAESVNLAGFFLTDDPEDLNKWELPSLDLAAGGFVVIL